MTIQQETKTDKLQFKVQTRAVILTRVSGRDKESDSTESQMEVNRTYCHEKGYNIVAELNEPEQTKGDDWSAPEINRALEMARAGQYDVLVVRDVKRYTRDIYKAMDFERRFFDAGIKIEYPWNPELNGLSQHDGMARMMRFLRYWEAEQDRIHTVSKLYKSRVFHVKERGKVMTQMRPPYGYREKATVEGGKVIARVLVIDETEAQVVKMIFEWYVNSSYTLRDIQRELEKRLVLRPSETRPGTGGRAISDTPYTWSRVTIRSILSRSDYKGIRLEFKTKVTGSIIQDELTEPIPVDVPAIVSTQLWDAAQERLASNRKRTGKKPKYRFLFRSRARCAICNQAVRCDGDSRSKYRVYRCNSTAVKFNNPHKCNLPPMKRDVIDSDVWDWLVDLINDDKKLAEGYQEYIEGMQGEVEPLRDELARIGNNLSELQAQIRQQAKAISQLSEIGSTHAVEALQHDIMQTEELINRNQARRAEVESELARMEAQARILDDFDGFVADVRAGIKKAGNDFEKRHKIIETLDVTIKLFTENGVPKFKAQCVLYPDTVSCSGSRGYNSGRS